MPNERNSPANAVQKRRRYSEDSINEPFEDIKK